MQTQFTDLGIAPGILNILKNIGYETPTPIQGKSISIALEGKDLIGIAETGTGKTLAFGIPMIQSLMQTKGVMGLVLLPTRELALQVERELLKVGRGLGLKTAVLIGGMPMGPQVRALRSNPQIIIATPGRLIDHLQQRTVSLSHVGVLALDEADRMLDMGFEPQIRKILQVLPKERQTMLFSATLEDSVMDIARTFMKTPLRIEVSPPGKTVDKIEQEFFIARKEDKIPLLLKILQETQGMTLVFSKTKHGAKHITVALKRAGYTAEEIHSNRSLNQRKRALSGFQSGEYRCLVATDIAARGIDVKGISLVVNYDLPSKTEDYVHRIGRTARAGAEGKAISFALPKEEREIRMIERLIKKAVKVSRASGLPPAAAQESHERSTYARGYSESNSRRPFSPRRTSGFSSRPFRSRDGAERGGFSRRTSAGFGSRDYGSSSRREGGFTSLRGGNSRSGYRRGPRQTGRKPFRSGGYDGRR
ncbi:MAG: DEAD/DEAH box helicase [Candidatus Harrisonbacteria bacterium]|nr:DEAD/DEAH box helicase [Candidatus Harrisonbacteria bacterium]